MTHHTPTQTDQLYTCPCGFRAVWTTAGLCVTNYGDLVTDHVSQILNERAASRAYAEALCRRLEQIRMASALRRRLSRMIIAEYGQ